MPTTTDCATSPSTDTAPARTTRTPTTTAMTTATRSTMDAPRRTSTTRTPTTTGCGTATRTPTTTALRTRTRTTPPSPASATTTTRTPMVCPTRTRTRTARTCATPTPTTTASPTATRWTRTTASGSRTRTTTPTTAVPPLVTARTTTTRARTTAATTAEPTTDACVGRGPPAPRGSAGDDRRSPVYGVCSLLHGGRLVLADGGLGLGASPAVVPEITGDHLDHSGHRDGEEGSEHARQLHGDQDRDEHGQRVQLDGPGQDQWLQQVVLELLVDDEENRDNDQCRDRVNGCSNDRYDLSERRTDQRDEVGERHEQRDQPRKRHARGEQRDVGQDPADNGDHQIAGEISGNGLRTVGGHRANPGPVVGL